LTTLIETLLSEGLSPCVVHTAMALCSVGTGCEEEEGEMGGTVIRVEPVTMTLTVGQVAPVRIQIDKAKEIIGFELQMTYNPEAIEVQDADAKAPDIQIELGPFLRPDIVGINKVDAKEGTIHVAAAVLKPESAVSGSGVLATITFQGKAAGTSPIRLKEVLVADKKGDTMRVRTRHGRVTVK